MTKNFVTQPNNSMTPQTSDEVLTVTYKKFIRLSANQNMGSDQHQTK